MMTGDSDTCIMHGFERCEVEPCMEAEVCYDNVLYLDVVHVFVEVWGTPSVLLEALVRTVSRHGCTWAGNQSAPLCTLCSSGGCGTLILIMNLTQ